eukprot:CAMPEP_0204609720 /NCGR_PEP_ID=MMETSP0661-20131031/61086_1 /ASSEMBLY_ACC=CAM_ASM_000606 /TAXON_ID=109239 /ORGANISM="Alexandrium margalefi, Strain AMGDE01CS-322" /LENGTH=31 /DNA_ID= /DNA_START= /DNA_END= /DNA_ORIENTATION=
MSEAVSLQRLRGGVGSRASLARKSSASSAAS